MIKIQFKKTNNINLISMVDGKANTIDEQFLEEFHRCLENADNDKPLLITGNRNFFSSGLDLFYAHKLTITELQKFFCNFQDLLLSIVRFPSSVTAVVEGHTIAGGFILLCACDRRFAVNGDYLLGVNEERIGFSLPPVPAGLLDYCFGESSRTLLNAEGFLKLPDFEQYDFFTPITPTNNFEDTVIKFLSSREFDLGKKMKKAEWLDAYLEKCGKERLKAFLDSWFDEQTIANREKILAKING